MLIPTLLPTPPVATPGVLNLLFEPSTALHALVVSSTPPPFDTYAELVRWTTELISALPRDDPRLIEILGSHPRLGEKQVESEVSRAEQKSLGEGEERLRRLNSEYEEKFPGLRYVVFVNSRPRGEIMSNMSARIARGDIELEKQEATTAMRDIALDRAAKFTAAS